MATLLLGDIGGTNARLMLAPDTGRLPEVVIHRTADFPTLEAAIGALLKTHPEPLAGAAFSVAGPVAEGVVQMTNCPWRVSAGGIAQASGVARPIVINDFAALAHGLSVVEMSDLRAVGRGNILDAQGPQGLLGPGTGLGVASRVPDGRGGFLVLGGEGGHVDMPAGTARELAVLGHLLTQHHHVSVERVLSGPGLETLYATLTELDGKPAQLAAPAIDDAARSSADPYAMEAVAMFTGLLGSVAGNLALTLGATGGLYIGGGILPRWGALFDTALFRARFESKGRFRSYLERIPTALITAPDIAFRGLRMLALGER